MWCTAAPCKNTDALANPDALEHSATAPSCAADATDAGPRDLRIRAALSARIPAGPAQLQAIASSTICARLRRAHAARARRAPRSATCSAAPDAGARPVSLGRRRPRQDVPDGPVPRACRRAGAPRALPSLHEGRARAPATRCATARPARAVAARWRATCACCASTNSSSATSPMRCCSRACSRPCSPQASTLVFTSNAPPADCTGTACSAQRFLPAIALIERHTEVVNVDAGTDYRLRQLEKAPLYVDAAAATARRDASAALRGDRGEAAASRARLSIEGRPFPSAQHRRVIWFDFAAICDGPRSQADYIEIARDFHTVLVSGVPRFDATRTTRRGASSRWSTSSTTAASSSCSPPPRRPTSSTRRAAAVRVRAHTQPPDRDADARIPGAAARPSGRPESLHSQPSAPDAARARRP